MDYYQVLGVAKKADESQIKRAYKKLAIQYHPDKNQGDEKAVLKFKEIAEAYEVLGDPQKRSEYDQFGRVSNRKGAYSSPANDFFNSFFGGGRQQRVQKLGKDIFVDCIVDLKFVYTGGNVAVKYQHHEKCSKCNGVGGEENTCNRCNGIGVTIVKNQFMSVQTTCNICGGSGKTISKKCDICQEGLCNPKEDSMDVYIPAGIEDGSHVQIAGKGEPGIDGNGNLLISIKVSPHEFFTRLNSINLLSKVPVTFSQLISGCKLDVATLSGNVVIDIPPQTKSGTKFRLRDQGLPNMQNNRSIYGMGEMIVEVVLETPSAEEYEIILDQLKGLEERCVSDLRIKYKKYLENNN